MHGEGVVHGDIKPDNLLLGGLAGVALSDLGCASKNGNELLRRPRHGTPAYMAPEMFTAHCRYKYATFLKFWHAPDSGMHLSIHTPT